MNGKCDGPLTYKRLEDISLLELIGNQRTWGALTEFYERYRQPLSRFIQRGVYKDKLVDEIYNDVMLTVWHKASDFQGESKVSTWIFTIAYRSRISHTRKENRQTHITSDELSNDIVETSDQAISESLTSAMSNLFGAQKTVIELVYFHGYNRKEIATIVYCPQNTVKTRLYHARRNLKVILEANSLIWATRMPPPNKKHRIEHRLEPWVFDYVAGHLTGFQKRAFERELRLNISLQQQVNNEGLLRSLLTQNEQLYLLNTQKEVSTSNLSELWSKIDTTQTKPQ